jgi:hypothetical protein
VALKHGLDINELSGGTEIEIDTSALESDTAFQASSDGSGEPEDVQYDKNELYKQVSLEPLIGSRDESSGSELESDDGLVRKLFQNTLLIIGAI